MRFLYYPKHLYPEDEGDVETFIRKDLKKRLDLRSLVDDFRQKVQGATSLQPFYDDETIKYLAKDGIFEMRIPKTKSGGVVRIYFCHHPKIENVLVLLDAELKHDRTPQKTDRAKDRMKIFLNDLKKGGKNEQPSK
jgi:hypothetical protein